MAKSENEWFNDLLRVAVLQHQGYQLGPVYFLDRDVLGISRSRRHVAPLELIALVGGTPDSKGNPAVALKIILDSLDPALRDKTGNRLAILVDDGAGHERVGRAQSFVPRADGHQHRAVNEFDELFRDHHQHLEGERARGSVQPRLCRWPLRIAETFPACRRMLPRAGGRSQSDRRARRRNPLSPSAPPSGSSG